MPSISVCFVAPLANVLFDGGSDGVFGGSEIRAWTLARALARIPGFKATMVVQGSRAASRGVHDGVAVTMRDFAAPPERSGFVARFRGMLARGSAGDGTGIPASDVVCAFGAVSFNARLAEACRRRGKKFVLLLGSDIDVAGTLADAEAGCPLDGLPPREDARAALAAADLVIAQTQWQAQRVEEATGNKPAIVPSPVELGFAAATEIGPRREILWIGKTDRIKRPQLAIEAARLAPDLAFRIVANPSDRTMWGELASAAPANVALMERFPFEESDAVYGRALVLLNTSAFEGFPNAFLQAGRHGVPVVSAGVDPDGFLRRTGAGVVAGPDPAALAAAIRRLVDDPQAWRRASDSIRTYVAGNHDSAVCTMLLARHLKDLMAGCGGRAAPA